MRVKYIIICALVMLLVVINVTNLEKSVRFKTFQLAENVISYHAIGFEGSCSEIGNYTLTFVSDDSYHILKSASIKGATGSYFYYIAAHYDFPKLENNTSAMYVEAISATVEGYASGGTVYLDLTVLTPTSSYSYTVCALTTVDTLYTSEWYNRYQWEGHEYHENISARICITYVGSSPVDVYIDFAEVNVKYSSTVPPKPVYVPPVADFTYKPANPKVNETVTFNATSSYAINGTLVGYKWDFGDGNVTNWLNNPVITHSYACEGSYSVTLTVKDSFNQVDNVTKSITVGTVKPILPSYPPLMAFIYEHPLTIALCVAIIAVALFVKK